MTINLYELADELLAQGQPIRFRAPGRSMEPTIPDGAEIVVEPLSPDAPVRVGDIALARVGDRLIAHRVIAVEGDGATARFFLRGDAQCTVADVVLRSGVLGRVNLRDTRPRQGRLRRFCRQIFYRLSPQKDVLKTSAARAL